MLRTQRVRTSEQQWVRFRERWGMPIQPQSIVQLPEPPPRLTNHDLVQHVDHRLIFQCHLGLHPLQLRVLSLKIFHPFELGDRYAAVLAPLVELRRAADPMFADQIANRYS